MTFTFLGFFVVVNGIPSVGVQVMVGSGSIGNQTMQTPEALPESSHITNTPDQGSGNNNHHNAGVKATMPRSSVLSLGLLLLAGGVALL